MTRKNNDPQQPNSQTSELALPYEPPASDHLGERLRAARRQRKWTLDITSKRCSVGRSTLSKIENGAMSPTFEILKKITRGLEIDLVELFDDKRQYEMPSGRRSITRKGQGKLNVTKMYRHELLATDLSQKRMLPFRTTIFTHSLADFDGWVRHDGEEVLIVVSGIVEVHTEYYAPVLLSEGDSIYFDSRMGHAAISASDEDAVVIWVCAGAM